MDVRTRSKHENILARKQRIEGGCASSEDIQQHSKRLRWLSTQRDAAARLTAARKNMKWLCDLVCEETKCVWQCRDSEREGLSAANLVHPTRRSICRAFPAHRVATVAQRFRVMQELGLKRAETTKEKLLAKAEQLRREEQSGISVEVGRWRNWCCEHCGWEMPKKARYPSNVRNQHLRPLHQTNRRCHLQFSKLQRRACTQ